MTEQIAAWNDWVNGYVWGLPLIILLIGTGLLLTVITGGACPLPQPTPTIGAELPIRRYQRTGSCHQ